MFSRRERLERKTPAANGIGRFDFLQQLIKEFYTSKDTKAKEQVVANLANFAYDPINYDFLKTLKVLDLFLDLLTGSGCGSNDTNLIQFAVGGVCNLCLDPEFREYLVKVNGVKILSNCLFCKDDQTVLSAITSLIFIINNSVSDFKDLFAPNVIERMKYFSTNCSDSRFQNLATIFLQDCKKIINDNQTTIAIKRNLSVGEKIYVERVITKKDVELFGEVTGDWNPVHFHFENKSIVHGALLNGLVSAAIGTKLPGPGTILVEQTLRFPNPCYEGEKVKVAIEIVSVRRIVECKYVCTVAEKVVLHGLAKVIVPTHVNNNNNNSNNNNNNATSILINNHRNS